jgi:2'-5' RNA ligase
VRRDKLHLTLHFLGEVPRERLPELARELVVPVEPFQLRLNRDQLWEGGIAVLSPAAMPEALRVLHAGLHDVLRRLQLTPARERLRPHVTLARRAAGALRPGTEVDIAWPVGGYALVESQWSSGYRVLRAYGAHP